jgi:heme-degrading monooxygenase HmoA
VIARLGVFEPMPEDIHAEYRRNLAERFKPALAAQDGFVAGYWLQAPDGRELSFTVWASEAALATGAQRANATPLLPGQDASRIPSPSVVETFEVIACATGAGGTGPAL